MKAETQLRRLIRSIERTIAELDTQIEKPESRKIARIINSLERQKDAAERYGL